MSSIQYLKPIQGSENLFTLRSEDWEERECEGYIPIGTVEARDTVIYRPLNHYTTDQRISWGQGKDFLLQQELKKIGEQNFSSGQC